MFGVWYGTKTLFKEPHYRKNTNMWISKPPLRWVPAESTEKRPRRAWGAVDEAEVGSRRAGPAPLRMCACSPRRTCSQRLTAFAVAGASVQVQVDICSPATQGHGQRPSTRPPVAHVCLLPAHSLFTLTDCICRSGLVSACTGNAYSGSVGDRQAGTRVDCGSPPALMLPLRRATASQRSALPIKAGWCSGRVCSALHIKAGWCSRRAVARAGVGVCVREREIACMCYTCW